MRSVIAAESRSSRIQYLYRDRVGTAGLFVAEDSENTVPQKQSVLASDTIT